MSDHVIYVDRFQLREGTFQDFKRYATEMAEFVEKNEPGGISFNYFVGDDGAAGTAVFVFAALPSHDFFHIMARRIVSRPTTSAA